MAEVRRYQLPKLMTQDSLGQPERAARGSQNRLGEDRRRSVRDKAVLLVEAHWPGGAVAGETRRRVVAGYLVRRADLRGADPGRHDVAAAGPAVTGCPRRCHWSLGPAGQVGLEVGKDAEYPLAGAVDADGRVE